MTNKRREDVGAVGADSGVRVVRHGGVAGQFSFVAETVDGPLTFVGSEYGGSIVMVTPGGVQTFVSDPGRFASNRRFGCLLDETWVRNFLGEGS